jgi:hypothetical protein
MRKLRYQKGDIIVENPLMTKRKNYRAIVVDIIEYGDRVYYTLEGELENKLEAPYIESKFLEEYTLFDVKANRKKKLQKIYEKFR